MEGPLIKHLRRRIGFTQLQLADQLGVDQGTVSRWERSVEAPRPASAAALRDLLLRDQDQRALARSLAIVRNDVMSVPTSLLDSGLRTVEMSSSGKTFLRQRGYDPQALVGKDVYSWSERFGIPDFPRHLRESGLISGDALLFRFVRNDGGRGHVTLYEPIFSQGEFIGIMNYVTSRFGFDANEESTLELVEVVCAGSPNKFETLYAGKRGATAKAMLAAPVDGPLCATRAGNT